MGSSSESSASPVPTSTFDERSLRQSLLFAGSLKDLRNLRSQLYSAARYFESSYSNDPLKQPYDARLSRLLCNFFLITRDLLSINPCCRPRDTLKQYVVGALVNTVDHLGSDIGTLSETERRVSCLEQRLRTCRALLDHEGLSRRSLPTDPQKCQKRYVLPGKSKFMQFSLSFSLSVPLSRSSVSFLLRGRIHGCWIRKPHYAGSSRNEAEATRWERIAAISGGRPLFNTQEQNVFLQEDLLFVILSVGPLLLSFSESSPSVTHPPGMPLLSASCIDAHCGSPTQTAQPYPLLQIRVPISASALSLSQSDALLLALPTAGGGGVRDLGKLRPRAFMAEKATGIRSSRARIEASKRWELCWEGAGGERRHDSVDHQDQSPRPSETHKMEQFSFLDVYFL
ncbi:unnamed protein product [Spirodela intermedia]|uniref:Uncharacterized protein n=1 Tax=Spirodela intermedia TaxID=51605 RepID=A0A7I8J684_SPIIN|nr:unnamed protein product [Spirodela intermedia]CAA6665758.1 unnamed protein product [Spirodela intermedia]